MESKKQKLRNKINRATKAFEKAGGQIKHVVMGSPEVNYKLPKQADFALMDNERGCLTLGGL